MNTNSERNGTDPLHGSLLRIGERREIAIYLRDGTAWVTDFKHGHGEVSTAGAWFALNQDRWALRRAALDAITPLPADIVQRIEILHRHMAQSSVGPALRRALVTLVGELRGRLAKLHRPLLGPRPARPLNPAT
jgi:hypothetical protein